MTKILLVEDDKSLREIYGVRLLAEGYDIVSAGDGEEALAMAIKERPQLIVSDVMMPKISGFDMLDILRSTTETKDIRVIMMTALSSEDQRARGEALGADRYLVKSQVGIEDVVRAVHDVLADAPVSRPAGPQTFGGNTSAAPVSNPIGARPAAPVPPRPAAAPVAPLPGAQPAPAAPAPVSPPAPQQVAPQPPAPSALPRPTAPFSTTRPASLGDRVIHPISPTPSSKPDLGSLMDRELSADSAPVAAPPLPPTPPAPAPVQAPQPFVAAPPVENSPAAMPTPTPPLTPQEPEISFEETPRSDNPQPPTPFTPGPQPPTVS
ncbi:MAG TPA: response regulator [Candidatus Saccharimonadales bacterium]|nr:response regulator [Candidatus Saccharimonadales bacterium]